MGSWNLYDLNNLIYNLAIVNCFYVTLLFFISSLCSFNSIFFNFKNDFVWNYLFACFVYYFMFISVV